MIRQQDLCRFVGLIQRLKDQTTIYKLNSDSLLKNNQANCRCAPYSQIKSDLKQSSKDKSLLSNLDATFQGYQIKPRLSTHLKLPNFICNGKTSIKYRRMNHKRSSTSIIQVKNQELKKQQFRPAQNQPTLTIKALCNTIKPKIINNKSFQNQESCTLRVINLSQQQKSQQKIKNTNNKSLFCDKKEKKQNRAKLHQNFAQTIIKKKIKNKILKTNDLKKKQINDGWIIDGWEQETQRHQFGFNNI